MTRKRTRQTGKRRPGNGSKLEKHEQRILYDGEGEEERTFKWYTVSDAERELTNRFLLFLANSPCNQNLYIPLTTCESC